jgi:sarcosine oxidase
MDEAMTLYDYIVIGKGLFGGAAARYLGKVSNKTAVIGPDEPADPDTRDTVPGGVFASHYDQGRITRLIARHVIWSRIARYAIDGYRSLERDSGIDFYSPVGLLYVDSASRTADVDTENPLLTTQSEQIQHTFFEAGNIRWRDRYPHLRFPETHWILDEPAPAGYINPRAMLQAQLAIAAQQGTRIFAETVKAIQEEDRHVAVSTIDGNVYKAKKVLIAAGSFTNFHDLIPQKIPLKLKTETIILAQVSQEDAEKLKEMPVLIYLIEDDELEDIYMTPPIRYPDGHFYIKMGCNTPTDQWPQTLSEVQHWFRAGKSDAHKEAMVRALQEMLPDVNFISFKTKRCIVCYTPSGYPIIDAMSDRIYLAAGGNGSGAKGSDTLGRLAAGYMHDGRWLPDIPRGPFQLPDR